MKLGTSLRFLYPTGPQTYERFKEALAALPSGGFIQRPMGAFDTAEQAHNVLEIAAAARDAGLDGLLFEEVMVRHITGDHQQMLRSFALIGRHVMPAIRAL